MVDEGVVVRRGDSLWSITGRYLGPSATADEIAREWPRWHEANRDVIGDDPDLIRPGQVLPPRLHPREGADDHTHPRTGRPTARPADPGPVTDRC